MSRSLSSGAAAAAEAVPAVQVPPKTLSSAAPAPAAAVALNSPRREICLLMPCRRKRSIVWVIVILLSLKWRPNDGHPRDPWRWAGLAFWPEQGADGVQHILRLDHRLERLRRRIPVGV